MKSSLILVTGGARSGKSEFAERLLNSLCGVKGYIATAEISDTEMAYRVEKHRVRRNPAWKTFEIPYDLSTHLAAVCDVTDVVLLDCLSIYINNLLFKHANLGIVEWEKIVAQDMTDWLTVFSATANKTMIIVTNEVGNSIVPTNKLSRSYRDLVGLANQRIAASADRVYHTVCGITNEIKEGSLRL